VTEESWLEGLDEYADGGVDLDDDTGSGSEPASFSDSEPDDFLGVPAGSTAAERIEVLRALAAREGKTVRGQIAAELVALAEERAARQEKDALALAAEQAIDAGVVDYSDPAIQAGLRAQVEAERAAATDAFYRHRAADLKAKGFEGESVDLMLRDDREAMAVVEEWMGGQDAMLDHPAYKAHEATVVEQARAIAAARYIASQSGSVLDDAAEAEAGVSGTAAAVLAAGEGE
jgi:hypothetical protein